MAQVRVMRDANVLFLVCAVANGETDRTRLDTGIIRASLWTGYRFHLLRAFPADHDVHDDSGQRP